MGSIPLCQPPGLLASLVLLSGGHTSTLSFWAGELPKLALFFFIFFFFYPPVSILGKIWAF